MENEKRIYQGVNAIIESRKNTEEELERYIKESEGGFRYEEFENFVTLLRFELNRDIGHHSIWYKAREEGLQENLMKRFGRKTLFKTGELLGIFRRELLETGLISDVAYYTTFLDCGPAAACHDRYFVQIIKKEEAVWNKVSEIAVQLLKEFNLYSEAGRMFFALVRPLYNTPYDEKIKQEIFRERNCASFGGREDLDNPVISLGILENGSWDELEEKTLVVLKKYHLFRPTFKSKFEKFLFFNGFPNGLA